MKTIDEAAKHSFDMLSIAGADIKWIDKNHLIKRWRSSF